MGRLLPTIVLAVAVLATAVNAGHSRDDDPPRLRPRQHQLSFPERKGPCPQDSGQPPLSCSDKQCHEIPYEGVCQIQSFDGFPSCGCCPPDKSLSCSECGGDAGDGKCAGSGQDEIAFKGCPCAGNGTSSAPGLAALIPFMIPPAGFLVPPAGTPNPKQQCSPTSLPKCAECNGKQGWCQDGEHVGCPCQEDCKEDTQEQCDDESCKGDDSKKCTQGPQKDCACNAKCPEGDDQPECADDSCKGNDSDKCTEGAHKDCSCRPKEKCPEGDMILACTECGGQDDKEKNKCKGLGSENKDFWKGCDCWDDTKKTYPNRAMTVEQFYAAQKVLENLPKRVKTTVDPKNVTCWNNSADKVAGKLLLPRDTIDPNHLLYILREVACNNKCEVSPKLDASYVQVKQSDDKSDCEISVALGGRVEAYFHRQGASQGTQQQQCWDSTESIINQCIKNGPNKGWWNGPDHGQFYEAGFRPLNGNGSLHGPFPENGPVLYEALTAITRSKDDGSLDCVKDPIYVTAQMAHCDFAFGNLQVQGKSLIGDQQICTADPERNCLKSGVSYDGQGQKLGTWCVVAERDSCAFVIADKFVNAGAGFNGSSCITGQKLRDVSVKGISQCGPGTSGAVIGAGPVMGTQGSSAQTLCMVNKYHPELCGVK